MDLFGALTNARHSVLYVIACVLALLFAALALRRRTEAGGRLFVGASALLVIALLCSSFDVYARRGDRAVIAGACGAEKAESYAYAEARWNARLALLFLPASLLLLIGGILAPRGRRRLALAGAAVPLGLIGWNMKILREAAPSDEIVWSGVCRFWEVRDQIQDEKMRSNGCLRLQFMLDPKRYEYEKDAALLTKALPELPSLRKVCLDDLLAGIRKGGETSGLDEYLDNPLVGPDQRDGFAKSLNAIDRVVHDVQCSRSIHLCFGSRLPSDVAGVDAETTLRVRLPMRWLARQLSDCVVRHDAVFQFTVEGTFTSGGALERASLVDIDGLEPDSRHALVACAAEVLPSLRVRSSLPAAVAIRYRFWGAAPGIDGSQ